MESIFTAIFEKVDDCFIYVEELPGANTQGKTLEEVRENLHEAIELILLSNRELAEKEFQVRKFQCRDEPPFVLRKLTTINRDIYKDSNINKK